MARTQSLWKRVRRPLMKASIAQLSQPKSKMASTVASYTRARTRSGTSRAVSTELRMREKAHVARRIRRSTSGRSLSVESSRLPKYAKR